MGSEKKEKVVGQLDAILASASGVELTNAIPNPPAISLKSLLKRQLDLRHT